MTDTDQDVSERALALLLEGIADRPEPIEEAPRPHRMDLAAKVTEALAANTTA